MNVTLTAVLIAFVTPSFVSQAQTPLHVKHGGCAFGRINRDEEILTFDPDASTQKMAETLLQYVGLPTGRIVLYAATVANAQADIDENNRRIVFYNQRFIYGIDAKKRDWSATAIIAHELGHHILNHLLQGDTNRKMMELEADRYSGFLVQKLHASREQAQAGVLSLHGQQPTDGYPSEEERLDAVTNGWLTSQDLAGKAQLLDIRESPDDAISQASPSEDHSKRYTRGSVPASNNALPAIPVSPPSMVYPTVPQTAATFVSRCVFWSEPNVGYFVTSDDNIVRVDPNGAVTLVARKVPATAPGYAWLYVKAAGRGVLGVTFEGRIANQWLNGQVMQVGYVTNP